MEVTLLNSIFIKYPLNRCAFGYHRYRRLLIFSVNTSVSFTTHSHPHTPIRPHLAHQAHYYVFVASSSMQGKFNLRTWKSIVKCDIIIGNLFENILIDIFLCARCHYCRYVWHTHLLCVYYG